jgi:prepilin peptidase CpaA
MELFQLQNWPLLLVSLGMIACAVIDWWKFKVPNYLTFPLILGGWFLGLLHTCGVHLFEAGVGGIGASLAATLLGFLLLLPLLAINGVGAGDVKMTMGFAAWIGAFFGFTGNELCQGSYVCLWIVLVAFCAGGIIGGILSLFMMAARGAYRQYLQHARIILVDLVTMGSISRIWENAEARKSRWHKLPYGIPLCLGFVGYLLVLPHLASSKQADAEKEARSGALNRPAQVAAVEQGDWSK